MKTFIENLAFHVQLYLSGAIIMLDLQFFYCPHRQLEVKLQGNLSPKVR